MKNVVVFRHQMFKTSEPFIVQQAEALERYRPLYLGREQFGDGPPGSLSLALSDLPGQVGFARRLWQVVTRDPKPYLTLLEKRQPALIHAHFGVEGVYALPLARRLGVPLVTTFHGFDATLSTSALLTSGFPSWINFAMYRRRLAQHGDLFLCVSEFIRQRVLDLGFPEERTHVHYIGLDTQSVQPRDVVEEQPIVLHVARLVEKKGTAYLIRAFSKLSARFPGARLVIVGDGPLHSRLESLVERHRLGAQVSFLGALPHADVMTWIRRASMLVLPSVTARSGDAEGLGMVLLEAAAQGVPVIGTTNGGIPEAIDDGRTGFVVPERDESALAERMSLLLADATLRRSMGRQARDFCVAHFDLRHQSRCLEGFYDGLLRS